jgi:hypothetical protein
MKFMLAPLVLAASFILSSTIAQANEVLIVDANGVPHYTSWQAAWDRFEYDRHHVILGIVANFEPYRLQIARRNGNVQMIDLKNGTIILPTGATPTVNERVAVIGYYSKGTFIANRLIIRP